MKNNKLILCPLASMIARFWMPAVVFSFAYVAFSLLHAPDYGQHVFYIVRQCALMLEYSLMSLTVLVGGTLLIDYEVKKSGADR